MQTKIRTTIMRGGTSRALVFRAEDLPVDPALQDEVLLAALGSPDPYGRQIDGLGGATSTTSKVAIIGASTRSDIDVTYTFGQVSIDRPLVDRRGNCGNISSVVGPFALDEGMVLSTDPMTEVRFLNTNTDKVIVAHVPTRDGVFWPEGDHVIAGIPGSGSEIKLDYLHPGGSVTGRVLPTGNAMDILEVPGVGTIAASIVDAGNPVVFVRGEDVGISPVTQPGAIDADPGLLATLEAIRAAGAVAAGLVGTAEEATTALPSVPKLAFVWAPTSYLQIDGLLRPKESIDIVVKSLSMGKMHRAYQLTAGICTTVAGILPGTLVHDIVSQRTSGPDCVRIGHPSGVSELAVSARREGLSWHIDKVTTTRTARRLMEGFVYIQQWSPGRGGREAAISRAAASPLSREVAR